MAVQGGSLVHQYVMLITHLERLLPLPRIVMLFLLNSKKI